MDDELGVHKDAPAGRESTGWDGEQGPFLERHEGTWQVNFTDIGRADVVENTIRNGLDLSKLRNLTSKEFIARMNCLRLCIKNLPPTAFEGYAGHGQMVAYTSLWLVSAEKVDWSKGEAEANGIPRNLVGNDRSWASRPAAGQISGPGYLYVFALCEKDDLSNLQWAEPEPGPEPVYKRRRLRCQHVYVCQVTERNLAWRDAIEGPAGWRLV
jgi:hypothetical protein